MSRLLAVFAFGFLGLLAARPAEAHVFKYFETVSVLLHMEPGDSPFAGEPAQLFFYFNDTAGKFQVSRCDCRVKITEGDRVLYDEALTGDAKAYGDDVRLVNFTFPKKDIYKVDVSAKEADYRPFGLSYDVRIDRGTDASASPSEPFPWQWVGAAGGAILIGVALGYFASRRSRH